MPRWVWLVYAIKVTAIPERTCYRQCVRNNRLSTAAVLSFVWPARAFVRPAAALRRHAWKGRTAPSVPHVEHGVVSLHVRYASTVVDDSAMTLIEEQQTRDCRAMIDAAIAAVDPEHAIHAALRFDATTRRIIVRGSDADSLQATEKRVYDLSHYNSIVLVAFGKASAAMATTVLDILNATPNQAPIQGVVICKDDHVTASQRDYLERHNVTVYEASHPIPDARGVAASQHVLNMVHTSRKSLVIACLSGGGSALFCTPKVGLTLSDLQATNTALLQTGWNIQTINTIRKVLEDGKGGGLARACGCADSDVLSLILSDVLGDPLDLIASGPTVSSDESSTIREAWTLAQSLPSRIEFPPAVMDCIRSQYEATRDAPPTWSVDTTRSHHCLVGNNAIAVQAAAAQAVKLGYRPVILATQLQGEASTVAQVLVSMAHQVSHGSSMPYSLVDSNDRARPVALIAGGETTVSLPADTTGRGGRNQELALAAAVALKQYQLRHVVVASVGTDGTDGPTDAAGAVVDGGTVDRIDATLTKSSGGETAQQALSRHNAYPYLERKDAQGHSPLVMTGPTGTNVADVMIVLIHQPVK